MVETKYCQSCGMPLCNESDFGKEVDGSLNLDSVSYTHLDVYKRQILYPIYTEEVN